MREEVKKIGTRLKQVRELLKADGVPLTAASLASRLGVSRDSVTNYETGRAVMPVDILLKLYELGINPVFMLTGDGSLLADNPAGRKLSMNGGECGLLPGLGPEARAEIANARHRVLRAAAGRIERE